MALNVSLNTRLEIAQTPVILSAIYSDSELKFEGSINLEFDEFIEELKKTLHLNIPDVPAALEGLNLEYFSISFPKGSSNRNKKITFTLKSKFPIDAEKEVDISIIIERTDGKFEFGGQIEIGTFTFDISFATDKTAKTFIAICNHHSGDPIPLRDLVENITSDDELLDILGNIEIDLNNILFAYHKSNGETKILFRRDVGTDINLSNLPLVGKEFPHEQTVGVDDLQLLIVTKKFTTDEIQTLNDIIQDTTAQIPSTEDLPKGLHLAAKMQFGSTTEIFPLSVTTSASTKQNSSSTPSKLEGITSDNTKWFHLQKSFGPVHFERIGLQYQQQELWVLLDASLGIAGLSLALNGLSVSSPLDVQNLKPTFHLKGLGIDFKEGPVEVGGALLHEHKDGYDVYNGLAVLEAELEVGQLGLHAIGSYAYYQGHPSLFLYFVVDFPIGGPPFLAVDAIAGGFGYNRSLTVPEVGQLGDFPLVAEVIDGNLPNISGDVEERAEVLEEELEKLDQYIAPDIGSLFFALGIRCNSFKLIECFVLAIVKLGNQLEIDLLGVADISTPPEEGEAVTPLVEARMFLKASLIPEQGFLGISAQLDPSHSYLISKDCHLKGGFAFYTWFAGEHHEDFIVTLGGYHPQFKVPKHYPSVPRLGIDWHIDSHCHINGNGYFALCPHVLMAGLNVHLSYHDGSAHASLRVGADFLVLWKPFHYEINIYVDIQASYWKFHAEVGADLHLWGPEFGGKAKVDAKLFSFNIYFGDSSSSSLEPIDWQEFRQSFLPADDKICSIVSETGLVRQTKREGEPLWIVNPKHFSFAVSSLIPTKEAIEGSGSTSIDMGNAFKEFGIRSMGIAASTLQTKQQIKIDKEGTPVERDFNFEPIYKKAPTAMWGSSDGRIKIPDVNEARFVGDGKNPLFGFKITPTHLPKPGKTNDIPAENLQFETHPIPDAYAWNDIKQFLATSQNDEARRDTIRHNISSSQTRDDILEQLGFNLEQDVYLNPEAIADSFIIAPQVGNF